MLIAPTVPAKFAEVLRFRLHLESLGLAAGTINSRSVIVPLGRTHKSLSAFFARGFRLQAGKRKGRAVPERYSVRCRVVNYTVDKVSVRLEQAGQLLRWNWWAEKITLCFVTIMVPEELKVFSRFNALSSDPQV
jgi:hypothetical protein